MGPRSLDDDDLGHPVNVELQSILTDFAPPNDWESIPNCIFQTCNR